MNFLSQIPAILSLSLLGALSVGASFTFSCSSDGGDTLDCTGDKCDEKDREQGIFGLCQERRKDVFNPNQMAFTNTAIRWSCQDAPGIDELDKGQEYCESFALVQLPASDKSVIRGQLDTLDTPSEWSERYLELSDADFESLLAMEVADPESEAGACIFTSWQSDIYDPLPICPEQGGQCQQYRGIELSGDNFRMRHGVNSLEAATNLVEDCLQTFASVTGFDGKPVEDPFTRGCLLNQLINRTSYRLSDTTICTTALRLTECGCTPKAETRDFPEVLGSLDLRGFHLGSWETRKEPPAGCHYVETGDVLPPGAVNVKNIVACPLTATEVLDHASANSGQQDLKSYCDEKFADKVVVHVLLTKAAMDCDPMSSSSAYAETCTDRPWVLEP